MALVFRKYGGKNFRNVAHNVQQAKDERLFIPSGRAPEVVGAVLGQKMSGVSSQG